MNKVVIRKKVDEDGYVAIDFCKGASYYASMWFRNETQYKAFVFLLNLLEESGASSISISDEPDEEEKPVDNKEKTEVEEEAPVNNEETPDNNDEVRDNSD